MTKRLKGLYTDNDPIDQPEGTYRYLKNGLLTKKKGAISSEEGTEVSGSIPPGYTVLGSAYVYDGRIILFLTDGVTGQIGVYKDGNYTPVLSRQDLNFQLDSVIEAETIINNKQEVVVYFTDNINPVRYYNIDAKPEITSLSQIELFSSASSIPIIDLDSVSIGGSLKTGVYHFGIRMLSEDGASTGYLMFTSPIDITMGTDYSSDSYGGNPAGIETNKQINLNISGLDTSFDYYQIAIVHKEEGIITDTVTLPRMTITGQAGKVSYRGIEETTDLSLDELIINTTSYSTAKALAVADNTLYLGNLSRPAQQNLQRYVNNVTVKLVEKKLDRGGGGILSRDHYGVPEISFYDKSFKRGEVYALYLSFLMTDGSESPAYHIPGREAVSNETDSATGDLVTQLSDEIDNLPDYRNFHLYSTPESSTGMAYWDNSGAVGEEGELYPENDENWQVWTVNQLGEGHQLGNKTLEGQPVRHHHFPDYYASPHFTGTINDEHATVLGFKIEDLKLPSDVLSSIVGIKFYYAKPSDTNNRIIDQGFLHEGSSRIIINDSFPMDIKEDAPDGTYLMATRGGPDIDHTFFTFNGFSTDKNKPALGRVAYLKMLATTHGPSFAGDGDSDDDVFCNQTREYKQISSSRRYRAIKKGTTISHIGPNTVSNESNKGFSLDVYNGFHKDGESMVAIELSEDNGLPVESDHGVDNTGNNSVGYLAELCAIPTRMYFPFDQQELVWTGYIETDISKFDAVPPGDPEVAASGSVDILTGTDSFPIAQGSLEVTGVTGSGEFTPTMTIGTKTVDVPWKEAGKFASVRVLIQNASSAGTYTINISFDGEVASSGNVAYDTSLDIATEIADIINSHPTLGQVWSAGVISEGEGNHSTIIESLVAGDDYNGRTLTVIIPEQVADVTYPEGNTTSGGADTEYFTESDSLASIAQALVDEANTITGIVADWNVEREEGTSKIIISAKVGGQGDGTIILGGTNVVSGNPAVTYQKEDVSGGTSFDHFEVRLQYVGGQAVFNVPVTENMTPESVEQALVNEINNSSSVPYTASIDNDKVVIEANSPGRAYNGSIYINPGNTGITYTVKPITNGSGGFPEDAFTTVDIYGGDTFIGAYSFKRTAKHRDPREYIDSDYKPKYVYLIYFVCESKDNIRLRYEGELDWEVYYPASTYQKVLKLSAEYKDEDVPYFDNYIAYNVDYSGYADIKPAFANAKLDTRLSSFPTRIIRSIDDNTGASQDGGFKTFLENDFMDLTRSKGPLIKLTVIDNMLYAHMERTLIRTKGREELVTGDIRAFVGAGDILAVRPDEIKSTKEGVLGLQDPKTAISTPYGYFFVDRQARQVILVDSSPLIISDIGMKNFFYRELDVGEDQLIAVWDNKWKRILLTKKNSWTISYYPELQMWGSFHSYTPDSYFSDIHTFYAIKGSDIWKHNVEEVPGSFYGDLKDLEFTFIENPSPSQTKVASAITFITEVSDGNQYYKETFNSFRIRNRYQDSGEIPIVYFTEPGGNARHVEGTWRINNFRDMLVDGEVDPNKLWYKQGLITGKYVEVTLKYSNLEGKYLYLFDTNVEMRESIR